MVVVCHKMVGNICVLHGMRNSEQESMGPCLWVCVCAAAVGGVCGFVVCCAVSDTTPLLLVGVVVLGVLVVIVAGSRPVVLFEPGC